MRYLFSALAAILVAASAVAGPITPEQALERLNSTSGPAKIKAERNNVVLRHTAQTLKGEPAVYVFNRGDNDGYMLLSADDSAAPMLGYADSGSFDPEAMPEALAWWLDEYARQIEFARNSGMPAYTRVNAPADREVIEPLIKSAWDQGAPYNNMTPFEGATRTYTGCVATTMAQVMNYWQYPDKGTGQISYTCNSLEKRLTLNFANRAFDWDNMLDSYLGDYSDAQAEAVAYLMRACGYSVRMEYSTTASSALQMYIPTALTQYFKYDPNISYAVRAKYAPSQWNQMIYDNLKNVGPIPYGGTSIFGGAHSFICDGYDGNGYFHFNWGWSGVSNGYFLLEALSPSTLGIGGGAGGGYNFSQDAVLGIQPPTGEPAEERCLELSQGGSLTATVDGGVLSFGLEAEEAGCWLNYNPQTINVLFGAIVEAVGAAEGAEPYYLPSDADRIKLPAGYGTNNYTPTVDLTELELPDGEYKVTLAVNIKEETSKEWIPVDPYYPYYNYVYVTKANGEFVVKPNVVDVLHVESGEFLTELYMGGVVKVRVTVRNDTDSELTRGFAPVLFLEEGVDEPVFLFLGSSQYITVAPHSKVTQEWITSMEILENLQLNREQTMKFTFFDESTYKFFIDDFYADVVIKPNPGLPTVSVTNFKIDDAETQYVNIDGKLIKVYQVKDCLSIPVSFTAKLGANSHPFCYQMMACILGGASEAGIEILTYGGNPVILGSEAYNFSTTLSLPGMQAGQLYNVMPAYLLNQGFYPLAETAIYIVYVGQSGIDNVEADAADADAPIYNLQGVCVGTDWDALPAGLYIRSGKKILKH